MLGMGTLTVHFGKGVGVYGSNWILGEEKSEAGWASGVQRQEGLARGIVGLRWREMGEKTR